MSPVAMLIVLNVAIGACVALLLTAIPAWRRSRGTRLVQCPENLATAAVDVDVAHAVLTTAIGSPELRIDRCSRWPVQRGCGQRCLQQIAAAPHDCLVRTILARWYAGKSCVFCGRRFTTIASFGHMTALVGPRGITMEWGDVPPQALRGLLTTHRPACWNCHVAETFRRLHPELVVDRSKDEAESRARRRGECDGHRAMDDNRLPVAG